MLAAVHNQQSINFGKILAAIDMGIISDEDAQTFISLNKLDEYCATLDQRVSNYGMTFLNPSSKAMNIVPNKKDVIDELLEELGE